MGASATATITNGVVTAITLVSVGSEYTLPPIVTIAAPPAGGTQATATAAIYTGNTEVGMVPAVPGAAAFPDAWTVQTIGKAGDILDNRAGGVPDPRNIGPSMVQIGTEGGFLPTPVVWPNIPVGFERNPKNIVIGNVSQHNLWLGPAERADVIIDFSQFAGKTVILYNDAPVATPAADSRLDYYTTDIDQTSTGGTVSTLPGYGPNTRTLMAFHVSASGVPTPFNLTALHGRVRHDRHSPECLRAGPGPDHRAAGALRQRLWLDELPRRHNRRSLFADREHVADLQPAGPDNDDESVGDGTGDHPFQPKAIQELFTNDFGRMNATLGVELPFTNGNNQTTIPLGYVDPPTEIIDATPDAFTPLGTAADGTQFWKITHNGVDTHCDPLPPVQRPGDQPGGLGRHGEAARSQRAGLEGHRADEPARGHHRGVPGRGAQAALRGARQHPFAGPDACRRARRRVSRASTRSREPASPSRTSPINFGWEYVWHCHILSHEENDMMRPMQYNVPRALPAAPVLGSLTLGTNQVALAWTDPTPATPANLGNPQNEIGFRIQRAPLVNGVFGAYVQVGTALANATTFTDTGAIVPIVPNQAYSYEVVAYNVAGDGPASNAKALVGISSVSTTNAGAPTRQGRSRSRSASTGR